MPATSHSRRLRRIAAALAGLILVGMLLAAGLLLAGKGQTEPREMESLSPLTQGCLAAAWTAYVLVVFCRRSAAKEADE